MADIVDNEILRAEFQDGLSQVDENLIITDLDSVFESETRTLKAYFKAVNKETEETLEINNVFS